MAQDLASCSSSTGALSPRGCDWLTPGPWPLLLPTVLLNDQPCTLLSLPASHLCPPPLTTDCTPTGGPPTLPPAKCLPRPRSPFPNSQLTWCPEHLKVQSEMNLSPSSQTCSCFPQVPPTPASNPAPPSLSSFLPQLSCQAVGSLVGMHSASQSVTTQAVPPSCTCCPVRRTAGISHDAPRTLPGSAVTRQVRTSRSGPSGAHTHFISHEAVSIRPAFILGPGSSYKLCVEYLKLSHFK